MTGIYRFAFHECVPIAEARMSLDLALITLEGLFSSANVRLDAHYHIDELSCAIVIDGSNEVGAALVKVFTTLLEREFGNDSFRVERVDAMPNLKPEVSA